MPFAEDKYPVGDLRPGGQHESFRISVRPRAARRNFHGFDACAGQDSVERVGELPGAVADQEPEAGSAVAQVHQEVADLLCGPRPVRARGDTENMQIWGMQLAGLDCGHDDAGRGCALPPLDG